MAPDSQPLFHTMTSPNTNAFMTLLNNAIWEPDPMSAGFKILYVGKYKHPMIILEMASVDNDGWRKSALFDSLLSAIQGQIDVQNTADLISVISQEIPIDITAAFMDSTRLKNNIISGMNNIGNLTGLAFLHSDSKKAKNLA